jgi:hypothetical protein
MHIRTWHSSVVEYYWDDRLPWRWASRSRGKAIRAASDTVTANDKPPRQPARSGKRPARNSSISYPCTCISPAQNLVSLHICKAVAQDLFAGHPRVVRRAG